MTKQNNTAKIIAVGLGSLVLGGAVGALAFPQTETVEVEKVVEKEVVKEVEVPVEVVKEVPVEVTVEVPIDSGNLDMVLDHIYDNDGSVDYLTNDLDDDEVEKIVDRIVFINEVKKMAVDAVESELFDELDGELYGSVEFDEDDMERLRVDDDDDEIVIDDVDFDDRDADVIVTGSFEQDDVEYEFEAVVEFKDGEFDEIKDISVWN